MKSIFAALMMTLLSFTAHGAVSPAHEVLCSINAEQDLGLLSVTQKLNIDDMTSMSASVLKLVNAHLIKEGYSELALSFDEIKFMFSDDGNRGYDDLYITTYTVTATGANYTEVRSYPGDNAYGTISAADGSFAASVIDGDIYLLNTAGDDTELCE